MTGSALIPRTTIEEIVGYRNRALTLYGEAYQKLEEAAEAVREAGAMHKRASPGVNNYNHEQQDEVKAFRSAINLPAREDYLRTARKLVDCDAWAWIVQMTDLERLMDTQAKKELVRQMQYVPERPKGRQEIITGEEVAKGLPELTVENVIATLERFAMDAGTIFRRGIANVFSSLDRRFRSHDGFKIGSRIILTHVFNSRGSLDYGERRNQLIDVERVFAVLDGKPESSFTSALYSIDRDRRGYGGASQSLTETEYFRIRGFKNGNAHLWFMRDDLVEKVNKLLAEYYGEVIGDGQTQEEDPLDNVKTTPAKRYGFFPTPDDAAQIVAKTARLRNPVERPPLTVLEPSAGTGNLARLCITRPMVPDREYEWAIHNAKRFNAEHRFDNQVDCVEIQPALAYDLEAEGIYRKVYRSDFLALSPEVTGLYDRVVMNPPFDRERDIDHVVHALKFLKDNGELVAIMSAGTEFRQTKKALAFRKLMRGMNARFDDLPAGSFASVGTYVNTVIVVVRKNANAPSWEQAKHAFEEIA